MTDRLYYTDSYILSFKAKVTAVDEGDGRYRVRLDKSAFYPTSGGQLYDTGNLSGARVVEVVEENSDIYHVLDARPGFDVGDKVSGKIDGDRRRDNMQKHTGQHILSRAFIEVCGAETVSARLGEEDSTIDLNQEIIGEEGTRKAEALANEVIFENRPVSIQFVPHEKLREIPLRKIPDREEDRYRIIVIKDFDWSACGGTHCAATGSVGIIKITGQEKVHGNARLHFLTGMMGLEDYRWRFDQIERISNMFTRHGRESQAAVESLMEDYAQLKKKNAALRRELLPAHAEQWYCEAKEIGGRKIIALDHSGEDFKGARETALGIINRYDVIVMIGVDDKLLVAVSKDQTVSASDIVKRAAEEFGGRGGGSPQLAQGGGFRPDDIKVLLAAPEKILDI
jgi:alanyl-tRNA synthetase